MSQVNASSWENDAKVVRDSILKPSSQLPLSKRQIRIFNAFYLYKAKKIGPVTGPLRKKKGERTENFIARQLVKELKEKQLVKELKEKE